MEILTDFKGTAIRLTQERLSHILEHPEMREMKAAVVETLLNPEKVVRSRSDASVSLYYAFQERTVTGPKWLSVVVKQSEEDAFVLTAYLTDTIKKGEELWPGE